jgi:hypothetical protein
MSKKQDKPVVQTPVAIALATVFPLFDALQTQTDASIAGATSRSATVCAAIKTLHETSTDFGADCVAWLGDGKKSTKLDAGVKGTLADALVAKYGDKLHVNVRAEISRVRTVAQNWNRQDVRDAAEKSGIRKAYDTAKPRAAPEAETATVATVAPAYSQSMMVELVAAHFDDAVFALRAYLLRAADSIGVAKLGEIEVHLANKTRKA